MLTGVFERAGRRHRVGKVTTLGSSVRRCVLAIYGRPRRWWAIPTSKGLQDRLGRDLYAVLPAPPPAKPLGQVA